MIPALEPVHFIQKRFATYFANPNQAIRTMSIILQFSNMALQAFFSSSIPLQSYRKLAPPLLLTNGMFPLLKTLYQSHT
jgi:hypothetical protein